MMPKDVATRAARAAVFWASVGYAVEALGFNLNYSPFADKVSTFDTSFSEISYLMSPTAFDFQLKRQRPSTDLHLAQVEWAIQQIRDEMASDSPALTYAGLYSYKTLSSYLPARGAGAEYAKKIFFDLSGENIKYLRCSRGFGFQHENDDSTAINAGAVVLNTLDADDRHPSETTARVLTHEIMHVLGLDHSSTRSSVMADGNMTIRAMSSDDKLGLAQIFGVGPATSITVNSTFRGATALMHQVVLIDQASGRTHTIVTNPKGATTIKHIPAGSYWVAARELIPSPELFHPAGDPAKQSDILTSFYVDSNASSNNPADAATVEIEEDAPVTISLPLIEGQKKFDCYYAEVLEDYTVCSGNKLNLWESNLKCYANIVTPGLSASVKVIHDIPEGAALKKTDTSQDPEAHLSINLSAMVTGGPISISQTAYVNSEGFATPVADVDVDSAAPHGTYAGLCESGGEYALTDQLFEVMPATSAQGLYADNAALFPEHESLMRTRNSPRQSGSTTVQGGEAPFAVGPLACGVSGTMHSPLGFLGLFCLPLVIALIPRNRLSNRKV